MRRLILIVACLLVFASCASSQSKSIRDEEGITDISQLNEGGRRIGIPPGSKADTAAREQFPNAEFIDYSPVSDGFYAVKMGEIDAFSFTENILRYYVSLNPDLYIMEPPIDQNQLAIGMRLDATDLLADVNGAIKSIGDNGLREEMESRWLGKNLNPVLPEIDSAQNPTATIVVGTTGENRPMSYLDATQMPTGFDVEYAKRLAKELNASLEVKVMTWAELTPALQSGEIDLIIANLNVTEERRKLMMFSDTYVVTDIVMLVKK